MKRPKSIPDLIIQIQQPFPAMPRVRFRASKKFHGTYDDSTGYVTLDRKFIDKMVSTWIHEKIHALHPKISETQVLELEIQIIKTLSMPQKIRFFKEIACLL